MPVAVQRVEQSPGCQSISSLADSFARKVATFDAGHRLSQQHGAGDEASLVESGQTDLRGWDFRTGTGRPGWANVASIRITPGTVHRITGVKEVDAIEVSTTQLDDVVPFADDQGRAGATAR